MRTWREAGDARDARIDAGKALAKHKLVEARDAVALLKAIIRPGCFRIRSFLPPKR
jgi:malonate decarboxylase alpha subunit